MYQTTISSWALLVSKAIEHQGLDSGVVFKQAGLDPLKLSNPNARYSSRGMKKLWMCAEEITGDPCIGLKAASHWHPTTLHALGFAWMASSSLREALERTIRYLEVVSTASHLTMTIRKGLVYLEFPFNAAYVPAVEAMDAAIAVLFDMCRSSFGEGFKLKHIDLKRKAPECEQEYVDFFQAPVHFSASSNALVFDANLLDQILPTANPELVRVNDQIIAQHLAEIKKSDVVGQVKIEIINQLTSGSVSEDLIVKKMNISLRSLQRKLAAAQASYKAILEETRKELALHYIHDSCYSMNEITFLLGFSEPGNFSRAFKRWTGLSPSQYRLQS